MLWPLWKKKEAEKDQKEVQTTLDGTVEKTPGLRVFTREGVLDAVARHIVCTDQALALADDVTFRNCMVAMRPHASKADIPSTHDVTQYIHNEFVSLLGKFKMDILVCPQSSTTFHVDSVTQVTSSLPLAKSPAPSMAEPSTQLKRHSLV
jgi:hypothetical protein